MSLEFLTTPEYAQWLAALKEKIRNSQVKAALKINDELLALYWELGKAITEKQKQSSWGDKIITQLSGDLCSEFPEIKGFSATNLKYIRKWFQFYTSIGQQAVDQLHKSAMEENHEIGQQPVDPINQLSIGQYPTVLSLVPWGHHIQIFTKAASIEEALFYVQQTATNSWSRNVLAHQMNSGLYQRKGKALTNFAYTLPKPQSDLAHELLKNPYNLDFLSLSPESSERDLEQALITNMKKFLLELGTGFSFMGQQYYLKVGEHDYYIDLLFYHTRLHCYVVVELKITEFKPEFAGKLEFYQTAIDEQLKMQEDASTIGLLLCRTVDKVVVEYSLRHKTKPMGVAEYQHALPEELKAELPTEEVLEAQLRVDVIVPSTPLQAKIAQLKNRIAQSSQEEVQKERDKDDIRYFFNELMPQLEQEIESNLQSITPEFTKVEFGRRINGTVGPYFISIDLEAQMQSENITQLGLSLRMEGFKKGGISTFGIWKDLLIELHQFKYSIGIEPHKSWLEKLYHQKWTKKDIQELANRWCDEVVDEITEKLERIVN